MDISDIKDIIQLVNTAKAGLFKNYFSVKRPKTKIQELYNGILNNSYENDEIAARSLYNTDPTDKSYMILRRDLMDDLSQSLLFYDFSRDISSHSWRKIMCQRKLTVIQILLSFGARSIATSLAERLLQEATQLEFTYLEIQCLRILRTTAAINGNEEYFDRYKSLLQQKIIINNEELYAEEECQRIEVYLINTAARPDGVYSQAMVYINRLEEVRSLYTSFELELYRYRILLYALQINHEYEKAVALCLEAEGYLLQKQDIVSKSRIAEFKTAAMSCALKIRRFDDALEIGKECLDIYQEGKRNWYNILTTILKIYLYTQKYTSAWGIFLLGSQEKGFSSLPVFRQEMWFVYKGYLLLFIDNQAKATNNFHEISIADIMLSSGSVVQDKKGLNIALLILHILYSIRNADYELATSRMYLFQDYAKRYLHESEHKRTLIFLSMLKLLRKSKYNGKRAQQMAQEYYTTLINEQEKPCDFLESVEIIPYEVLWEWIVNNSQKLK